MSPNALRASETGPIGIVKTVSGTTTLHRGEQTAAARVGAGVFLNDKVTTSEDGRIGISFNDSTTLSLGEGSELRIDDFIYQPAEGKVGFGIQMLSGTMTYLSGKIAAIAPEQVSVTTPSSVIGIRGTKFLLKVTKTP